MERPGNRVLIIENDSDLGQLLVAVLTSAGYEAQWICESPHPVADVSRRHPDLLVVDLFPSEDSYQLLDRLRTDEATAGVPVVVITAVERIAEVSAESYNVCGFCAKPFDVGDLLEMVREALGRPPLQAALPEGVEPSALVAQAERVVAEQSRAALHSWVQRLQQEPPWRERKDLRLHELLNGVPVLVEAVVAALRCDGADHFFSRSPYAAERIREHARLRRGQGFPLSALIREYDILRDELKRVLWSNLPPQVRREDVLTIALAFDGALDRILEITARAFLEEGEEHQAA